MPSVARVASSNHIHLTYANSMQTFDNLRTSWLSTITSSSRSRAEHAMPPSPATKTCGRLLNSTIHTPQNGSTPSPLQVNMLVEPVAGWLHIAVHDGLLLIVPVNCSYFVGGIQARGILWIAWYSGYRTNQNASFSVAPNSAPSTNSPASFVDTNACTPLINILRR
ncbi:uncharacterized protein CLUP02_10100 [Colletotrichum lupini]|uniref:Uncharacterized protein n=1 Tax=Colletotrichum lupini TaxID=145971 RepID=A0A9Q8SWR0_9PEZI|nr:uncharacterized protein CLUP02_10100 [Colletotrichum lupini]UQC84603.1 hypothetical protein CLUP02_10100 [Colletotrichum lupini]